MPLLKAEAEKLSNNDLIGGVIEEIIDRDSVFNLLPFVKTTGKAYVYNREVEMTGNAAGTFVAPSATIAAGAATYDEITTNLRIIAGDVDVDKFLATTMDDTNDQLATQIGLKAKYVGRTFQDKIINGDSGATVAGKAAGAAGPEFDGFKKWADATASQTIAASAANGDALTQELLDELLDLVPNGADVIFMHSKLIRYYKALLRIAGGNDGAMLQLENFSRPVLAHSGVPILANDFIGTTDTKGASSVLSSIYVARMNELDGVHGIYGGDNAGMAVESIGTVQDKDSWRYRVKWYAGLALKSSKSLARATEIDTSTYS